MQEIKNNIYYCGLNHRERRLFDQLMPLPVGTTYNSYFIKGRDKNVIIDTMYPQKTEEYMELLQKSGIDKIDYIVANHAEQDHSGSIPVLLEKFPEAVVVTNPKCKEFIQEMLHVADDKFQLISNEEELSLGDKTLKFYIAPSVHWPDTMFTYVPEDKVIFTCDFLGAHATFDNNSTEDGIFAKESPMLLESAKRYYAEIMMPFRTVVKKYVKMLKDMDIEMILPSHGPIHRNPKFILEAYEKWSGDTCKNEVIIPYVSMYESTKEMVDYLAKKIEASGIEVKRFDLVETDLGDLAMEIVEANTIVFGTSMVLAGPHPVAVTAAYLTGVLRPKTKLISFIGSYGWGGKLTETLESLLAGVRAQKLAPVIVKGKPRKENFIELDRLADEICSKHKELGLI